MTKSFLYGNIEYNPTQIWKYLESDIEDDWFQDPILYNDYKFLKKELEYFDSNIKINNGRYKPSEKEIFYLPKSNFTLRYSIETMFYDRYMYFCLTTPLIKEFDKLLSKRVYNHRYTSDTKYLFLHPIFQWEKFEGIIRCNAKGNYILETDIQNYFENITIATLKMDLEKCLSDSNLEVSEIVKLRFVIDRLIECLPYWSYNGEKGLPQNRDCSSFLANIYMRSIDTIMIENKFDYYRYMDDIRIVCKDKYEARKALLVLVNALREKNLSLNGKKTRILAPNSEQHIELLKPKIELKKIDALLNTKKKANVAIGYNLIKVKCKEYINNGDFESREFRFCINRMSKLARCKDYPLPTSYWDDVSENLINSIAECPTSTDRLYVFFASVGLNLNNSKVIIDYLLDHNKSIYEWQNYWLWKLLIICNVKSDLCIEKAIDILNKNSQIPDKSGAILYLAQFGDLTHKKLILNSICNDDSIFLQRHKWIACKNLDWIKDEVQKFKSCMHEPFKLSYRTLSSKIKHYVSKPTPTKLEDILRSIHQYD